MIHPRSYYVNTLVNANVFAPVTILLYYLRMPRKRKTRSYTATDQEHEEMLARLPCRAKPEDIDNLSRLIVYAVLQLPRRKR